MEGRDHPPGPPFRLGLAVETAKDNSWVSATERAHEGFARTARESFLFSHGAVFPT